MASKSRTETVTLTGESAIKSAPFVAKLNSAMRFRNNKLDPTRALEPTRKKLSTIESQRIMSVFDDAIKRVKIVTALPYIVKNMDRFRVSLGVDLGDMIRQHFRIQGSYQEIRNQLDELLQSRARQIEFIEAKNAAALEAAHPQAEMVKKTPYDFFADDNDFDFEDDDEEDEEGDAQENENDAGSEEMKDAGEEEKKDEVEEQPSETKLSSSEEENGQPRDIGSEPLGTNIKSSRENVAENVSQMINEDSGSPESLVDYEPRIQEVLRNLGLVAQQVSHSCKNILRLFTLNPTAMNIINSDEEGMRNDGGQDIIQNMTELREILMTKLLSTPEEELEQAAYLEEISRRERHNKAVIEKLEKELQQATHEKDEAIRKNNEVIKRLQTDLHQIEKFSDESIRRTKAEAEKQENADSKNSDQRIQRLQAEIDALQAQHNALIAEHREIEAELRAKKYKVENEVENWIQKYDQDLGDRQDEYEEIDLIYTEEKKQLLELEERFAVLEKEYLGIMDERRAAREKREMAQRELNHLVKAATTIQAFWRSYKVRKALNKKKKKKKGGKGKGKGKKKGKGKGKGKK